MSYASKNIKYLRKLRGWTQEEFSNKLSIKRSLLGAYEEERAEPRIDVLEMVCDLFKLSLDEILRKDLSDQRAAGNNYLNKRRQQKLMTAERNTIHFVPVKAAAGYLAGYADPDFIDELNTFTLPMLSGGQYRAFEIVGDSMLPTPSGSVIVGEKVEQLDELNSNNTYVVISRNEGVVYKRVMKNNRARNKLTMVSDNPQFEPYNVNAEDVLEMWQAKMILTKANTTQLWGVTQLASLVNNLQQQVTTLKKKMN